MNTNSIVEVSKYMTLVQWNSWDSSFWI